MLQLQDSAGRILSSGHFRNAYDRLEPALPARWWPPGAARCWCALAPPTPRSLVLARLDSLRVAGAGYTIIGGTAIEPRLRGSLARDPDLSLRLVEPGTARPQGAATQAEAGASPCATLLAAVRRRARAAETSGGLRPRRTPSSS